jgi:hypothetical protein
MGPHAQPGGSSWMVLSKKEPSLEQSESPPLAVSFVKKRGGKGSRSNSSLEEGVFFQALGTPSVSSAVLEVAERGKNSATSIA